MKIAAYVQDKDGCPLMPVRKMGRVRRMLASGKAHIVSTVPLTIRLDYEPETKITDMVIVGEDPGRTNIGLCAINAKGEVLYASDVETRNKMIARLMLERKRARQASRHGERKVKQRRARRHGTQMDPDGYEVAYRHGHPVFSETGMGRRPRLVPVWDRLLPHYQKPVHLKETRNKEARYCNRRRQDGWLTPTANQLLQTHKNALDKVLKILPMTDIVLELNKFAFARMENPKIRGKEYCYGPLYGFSSVEDAVDKEQGCKCLFCKKKIDIYHHIIPRSKGGSDVLPNRAGLCLAHHEAVHKDEDVRKKLVKKKKGLMKKYAALSTLNQIIPFYWEYLQKFEPFIHVHAAHGWETKGLREEMGLPKDHYVDAWCIAASILDKNMLQAPEFDTVYHIMQFRRHNRAIIRRTESRKYYLDGKLVAKNRHKAIIAIPKKKRADDSSIEYKYKAQPEDSLEEFRNKMVEKYGEKETRRILGRLKVVKSKRCYNDLSRTMPGAVFIVDGVRHVMQGQKNNCARYEQAISGVTALKEESKALKKQLTAAEKSGNTELAAALENRIASVKAQIPEAPEYQKTICKVVLHNSGLVYVTDHAA